MPSLPGVTETPALRAQERAEFLSPLAETVARENLRNYQELYQLPLVAGVLALLAKLAVGADRFKRAKMLPRIWVDKPR